MQSGPLRIFTVRNAMPGARLGLIVGKRAMRRAHDRNRLKRAAREAFRQRRARLPALDVVLHVQAPIQHRELTRRLAEVLEQMSDPTSG